MLERNGRLGEMLGRRKDGADGDRTDDSQGDPCMQDSEQVDVWVGRNQREGMPQVEAKRLAGIDMQ